MLHRKDGRLHHAQGKGDRLYDRGTAPAREEPEGQLQEQGNDDEAHVGAAQGQQAEAQVDVCRILRRQRAGTPRRR